MKNLLLLKMLKVQRTVPPHIVGKFITDIVKELYSPLLIYKLVKKPWTHFKQWWGSVDFKILIYISGGLEYILISRRHFLFVLKISETFVFFLRTSDEYIKKYRQVSVFTTVPWKRVLKTYPCPYLVKYSLDVLK